MTVHIRQEFRTREEAEEWKDKYLSAYNPLGYGTSLMVQPLEAKYKSMTGYNFAVIGYRYETAD